MKNMYIKTIWVLALAVIPSVSSAYMLDPYPINANDNRTVYNAAVTTSLALVGQNQNSVYTQVSPSAVSQQVVVPAQTAYTTNVTQPATVYSVASANSGTQTYAGTGANSYVSTAVSQPIYTSSTGSNVSTNSWTYNLPTQSLMPASVSGTQFALSNPKLVAMDTSYKYSYANALPSYYGAGATGGIYTTYGGQNYDPQGIYDNGLALATGNSTRLNTNTTASGRTSGEWGQTSGEWVQTASGWRQVGQRQSTSGHIPW